MEDLGYLLVVRQVDDFLLDDLGLVLGQDLHDRLRVRRVSDERVL